MRRLALPVLAALFVLSGCAAQSAAAGRIVLPYGEILPTTSSAPTPDGPAPRPGLTSAKALGDPRTLSACALVDPGRMTGAEYSEQLNSLDTCELDAQLGGTDVSVYVGPLVSDLGQVQGTDLGHGLSAQPTDGGGAQCEGALLYPDYVDLQVEADVIGSGSADTCGLAQQAVKIAAGLSVRGLGGADAHARFQRGSFDALDPCALVTPAMQSAADLDTPDTAEFPEQHECSWTSRQTDLDGPQVVLYVGPDSLDDLQHGSTTQQIAGRTSYVSGLPPADGTTVCYLQTPQDPAGGGQLQVATIEVFSDAGGATADAVCAVATGVAAVVWPRLPGATK